MEYAGARREREYVKKILIDQNFCGIGLKHRALQSPRRMETG